MATNTSAVGRLLIFIQQNVKKLFRRSIRNTEPSSDKSPKKFYEVNVIREMPNDQFLVQINYGTIRTVSRETLEKLKQLT